MGFQQADLIDFLRSEVKPLDGVAAIRVLESRWEPPRFKVFVEVLKGLSAEGHRSRSAVYRAFENYIRERGLEAWISYQVLPVGDALPSPEFPEDAEQVDGTLVA